MRMTECVPSRLGLEFADFVSLAMFRAKSREGLLNANDKCPHIRCWSKVFQSKHDVCAILTGARFHPFLSRQGTGFQLITTTRRSND